MAQPDEPSKGNTEEVLTQKQYAERKGWSKQYVNQLVKRGRIPLKDGKIDPASADAALARDKDPARNPVYRATAPDSGTSGQAPPQLAPQALQGSFSKARTVRELYRARREKLEYERQAGNLVSVYGIESAVETLTAANGALRSWPSCPPGLKSLHTRTDRAPTRSRGARLRRSRW